MSSSAGPVWWDGVSTTPVSQQPGPSRKPAQEVFHATIGGSTRALKIHIQDTPSKPTSVTFRRPTFVGELIRHGASIESSSARADVCIYHPDFEIGYIKLLCKSAQQAKRNLCVVHPDWAYACMEAGRLLPAQDPKWDCHVRCGIDRNDPTGSGSRAMQAGRHKPTNGISRQPYTREDCNFIVNHLVDCPNVAPQGTVMAKELARLNHRHSASSYQTFISANWLSGQCLQQKCEAERLRRQKELRASRQALTARQAQPSLKARQRANFGAQSVPIILGDADSGPDLATSGTAAPSAGTSAGTSDAARATASGLIATQAVHLLNAAPRNPRASKAAALSDTARSQAAASSQVSPYQQHTSSSSPHKPIHKSRTYLNHQLTPATTSAPNGSLDQGAHSESNGIGDATLRAQEDATAQAARPAAPDAAKSLLPLLPSQAEPANATAALPDDQPGPPALPLGSGATLSDNGDNANPSQLPHPAQQSEHPTTAPSVTTALAEATTEEIRGEAATSAATVNGTAEQPVSNDVANEPVQVGPKAYNEKPFDDQSEDEDVFLPSVAARRSLSPSKRGRQDARSPRDSEDGHLSSDSDSLPLSSSRKPIAASQGPQAKRRRANPIPLDSFTQDLSSPGGSGPAPMSQPNFIRPAEHDTSALSGTMPPSSAMRIHSVATSQPSSATSSFVALAGRTSSPAVPPAPIAVAPAAGALSPTFSGLILTQTTTSTTTSSQMPVKQEAREDQSREDSDRMDEDEVVPGRETSNEVADAETQLRDIPSSLGEFAAQEEDDQRLLALLTANRSTRSPSNPEHGSDPAKPTNATPITISEAIARAGAAMAAVMGPPKSSKQVQKWLPRSESGASTSSNYASAIEDLPSSNPSPQAASAMTGPTFSTGRVREPIRLPTIPSSSGSSTPSGAPTPRPTQHLNGMDGLAPGAEWMKVRAMGTQAQRAYEDRLFDGMSQIAEPVDEDSAEVEILTPEASSGKKDASNAESRDQDVAALDSELADQSVEQRETPQAAPASSVPEIAIEIASPKHASERQAAVEDELFYGVSQVIVPDDDPEDAEDGPTEDKADRHPSGGVPATDGKSARSTPVPVKGSSDARLADSQRSVPHKASSQAEDEEMDELEEEASQAGSEAVATPTKSASQAAADVERGSSVAEDASSQSELAMSPAKTSLHTGTATLSRSQPAAISPPPSARGRSSTPGFGAPILQQNMPAAKVALQPQEDDGTYQSNHGTSAEMDDSRTQRKHSALPEKRQPPVQSTAASEATSSRVSKTKDPRPLGLPQARASPPHLQTRAMPDQSAHTRSPSHAQPGSGPIPSTSSGIAQNPRSSTPLLRQLGQGGQRQPGVALNNIRRAAPLRRTISASSHLLDGQRRSSSASAANASMDSGPSLDQRREHLEGKLQFYRLASEFGFARLRQLTPYVMKDPKRTRDINYIKHLVESHFYEIASAYDCKLDDVIAAVKTSNGDIDGALEKLDLMAREGQQRLVAENEDWEEPNYLHGQKVEEEDDLL